ncbi:hypothetical protein GPECTOR_3g132 [Gonium pectorale]|uniref:Transcription initiation factor TFIID component TAF4 C-terminal domain-containing protein n=1 Tax=Gonium pectorale TaxID=33097 RepID=A0A150GYT5_GONPE|nr:hypothetical protein GPECTOR_3g132 [Gonium pectorale]|eukprot:KXZ54965.1 hypothetical protein GPECTOR_3g132 [Gonium pectorale]
MQQLQAAGGPSNAVHIQHLSSRVQNLSAQLQLVQAAQAAQGNAAAPGAPAAAAAAPGNQVQGGHRPAASTAAAGAPGAYGGYGPYGANAGQPPALQHGGGGSTASSQAAGRQGAQPLSTVGAADPTAAGRPPAPELVAAPAGPLPQPYRHDLKYAADRSVIVIDDGPGGVAVAGGGGRGGGGGARGGGAASSRGLKRGRGKDGENDPLLEILEDVIDVDAEGEDDGAGGTVGDFKPMTGKEEYVLNEDPTLVRVRDAARRFGMKRLAPDVFPYIALAAEAHLTRLLRSVGARASQRTDPARAALDPALTARSGANTHALLHRAKEADRAQMDGRRGRTRQALKEAQAKANATVSKLFRGFKRRKPNIAADGTVPGSAPKPPAKAPDRPAASTPAPAPAAAAASIARAASPAPGGGAADGRNAAPPGAPAVAGVPVQPPAAPAAPRGPVHLRVSDLIAVMGADPHTAKNPLLYTWQMQEGFKEYNREAAQVAGLSGR